MRASVCHHVRVTVDRRRAGPFPRGPDGTWSAHRRRRAGEASSRTRSSTTATWTSVQLPHHWRSVDEFAASDGPVLYRRRFTRRCARRRAGARSSSSTASSTTATSGSTATTSARPRATSSRTRSRSPTRCATATNTCSRSRSRARRNAIARPSARSPASSGTGTRPTRLQSRRAVAADPSCETGPVRITTLRVLCTEALAERGRLDVRRTLDADDGPLDATMLHAESLGPDGETLLDAYRDRSRSRPVRTGSRGRSPSTPRRAGGRRRWATAAVHGAARRRGRRRRQRQSHGADRVPRHPRDDWMFSVNGERVFLKGTNLAPTRMALGDATPDEMRRDLGSRRKRTSTSSCARARRAAGAVRRGRRARAAASGRTCPLQWGYARSIRRQAARQARAMVDLLGHHPSVMLWCAHNAAVRVRQRARATLDTRRTREVRSRRRRCRRGASRSSTARSPARSAVTTRPGRSCATAASRRASGSAGTDSHFSFGWDHGELARPRGRTPALAATRPVRVGVRRAGCARARRLDGPGALARSRLGRAHASPRAATRRVRASHATGRCEVVRRVARHDAGVPGRAPAAPDRRPTAAEVHPDRRLRDVLARRSASGGQLVGARSRAAPEARLRRAARRLPSGARDGRAAYGTRARRERHP